MSLFDPPEKPYEFIKSQPANVGSVQHFARATFGAGESSIIQLDSEGAKFGGRTLTDAKAYIKTDGTYKFKDASGNEVLSNLGLQVGALSSLPSIQGWTSDLTFSATDYRTVAWSSGTIKLTNGTAYSTTGGNTGNMAALTYIYLDVSVSTTALQKTTTAANSVGANKILIAVAQNNSDTASKATFQVFGGKGGQLLTIDNIAANSASTNELISNTAQIKDAIITSAKIASLNADVINAGTITGRTVKATSATSGANLIMDAANKRLAFLYDNVEKSFVYGDSGGNLIIDADNLVFIQADGVGDDIILSAGDSILVGASGTFADLSADSIVVCDHDIVYYRDFCQWIEENVGVHMQIDGSGDLYVSGVVSADNIDYAEMFESSDGKRIPTGTTVVFAQDGKIRPAKNGEIPFGMISGTAAIVLGSGIEWNGKYLRNELGEYEMEEVSVWRTQIEEQINKPGKKGTRKKNISGIVEDGQPIPKGSEIKKIKRRKINPLFDVTKKFIPRKERQEWHAVGLTGRVRILKGQPVSPNWIKIKDISDTVEEWLIK